MSDKNLESTLAEANSHDEIAAALHSETDHKAREPRAKAEPEPEAPGMFTHTETIKGKEFIFEAETELELERMVSNAFRVAHAVQEPVEQQEVVEQVVDPAKEAVAQAELEIKFKNGQISASEYLERSGAIAQYLEKQGVPVQELKETVEQSRDNKFTQSWADATTEFLKSPAGADWPGGERNKELIGLMIARLGLVDADDKVLALSQAYNAMKSNGMVFADSPEGSESSQAPHTQAAPVRHQQTEQPSHVTRQQPTRQQPTRQSQQRASSSLFGQSSGTSQNDIRDTSRNQPQFSVPSNASPEEIISAWKQNVLAQGGDPNSEFTNTFSGRK